MAAARPLAAQYPNVPPPVPCLAGDAMEGMAFVAEGPTEARSRLAIEPFRSTLGEGDTVNSALAAAFTDRIAARLAPVHPVQLWTARMDEAAPVARIVTLGRLTRAHHLLVGRISPAERGFTLTLRLYETTHGATLWTRTFNGQVFDLAWMEDSVARIVAARVGRGGPDRDRSAITPPATRNGAAYFHYLRGAVQLASNARHAGQRAMEEFSVATQLDSTFAPAWSGLALSAVTYIEREGTASPEADTATISRGLAAAQRATAIAPKSADAWSARGAILELHQPRTYTDALAAYRKAIDLDSRAAEPHRRYARALLHLGAYDAATEQLRLALSAAPGDPRTLVMTAGLRLRQRRFRDACRALDIAALSDPLYADAYSLRAFTRTHLHDVRNAWVDAETGARLGAWLTGPVAAITTDALAHDTASAAARMKALAGSLPDALRRPSIWEAAYLAEGYLALGQDARAMELVARATPRGAALWYALQDPVFDRVRGGPQLDQVLNDSRPTMASAP